MEEKSQIQERSTGDIQKLSLLEANKFLNVGSLPFSNCMRVIPQNSHAQHTTFGEALMSFLQSLENQSLTIVMLLLSSMFSTAQISHTDQLPIYNHTQQLYKMVNASISIAVLELEVEPKISYFQQLKTMEREFLILNTKLLTNQSKCGISTKILDLFIMRLIQNSELMLHQLMEFSTLQQKMDHQVRKNSIGSCQIRCLQEVDIHGPSIMILTMSKSSQTNSEEIKNGGSSTATEDE